MYFGISIYNWPYQTPCNYTNGANGVHYWDIPEANNALAETWYCTQSGRWNIQIVFDSSRPWNVSNGFPPSGTTDLEGVAAQEFGHAYGWGLETTDPARQHFLAINESLCGFYPIHTMCANAATTSYDARTPEAHDIHTMDAAFP